MTVSSSASETHTPTDLDPFIERLARHTRASDAGISYERARLTSVIERGAVALAGPWGDVILRTSPWDSDALGIETGRIEAFRAQGNMPNPHSWAETLGVRHLSVRLPFTDVAGARVLEQAGFQFAEVSLNFAYEGGAPTAGTSQVTIRTAQENDQLTLPRMASDAFVATRFHLDPEIGEERGNAVYSKWTADALAKSASDVLVADMGGSPIGFAVCKFDELAPEALGYGIGELDLLVVAKTGRNKGTGRALVDAALIHMLGRVPRVEVMTSASNTSAIRVYQRVGSVLDKGITRSGGVTFHWWAPETTKIRRD